MFFYVNVFTVLVAIHCGTLVHAQDNSSTSNTTVPISKPPPPVPLPPVDPVVPTPISPTPIPPTPPKPKPTPPVVVISKEIVSEAKVPATTLTEYQRFGHSVASYGSAVAVGTSKESLSATVFKYTVEVTSTGQSSQYGEGQLNVTCSELDSIATPTESNSGDYYYDGFGLSVALSADVLMVAAPYRSTELAATSSSGYATGAVFAFSSTATAASAGSTSASASEVLQRLVPSSPNANMQFGASLALLGSTLAVGAPGANPMGQMSGAVYVYAYSNESRAWEETEVLQDSSGGAAFAQFGSAVFLSDDGSALAVGASGYSKHAVHGGAVFLYQRSASTAMTTNESSAAANGYSLQSILVPSDAHGYAYFGRTVYFRGPVGLVSAYDENGSGVVYLYERVEHQPSTDTTDFKQAAAYLCRGCLLRGAATFSAQSSWVLKEVLRPAVSTLINQFGASLAIFHTSDANYAATPFLAEAYVVAVGAPGDVTTELSADGSHAMDSTPTVLASTQLFAGSVYLYLGPHNFTSASTNALVSSDKWTYLTKVLANDSSAYDAYGRSLSLMGAHLLVGAELANSATAHKTGAVYLETNLIPYLVSAAQRGEEENQGGGDGSNQSGESVWTQFLAFFSTSGGIVTMSFLPIAVLLVAFVAHSKTKGKPVLSSVYSCKARLLQGGSTHVPLGGEEEHGPKEKSQDNSELGSDSTSLRTVFDNTKTSSEESVLSPTRPENATTATDSTPSLWQRWQHFLRNPMHSTGHMPLATESGASGPEPDVQTTVASPSDLRLHQTVSGRTSEQAIEAGLSIRSPITHIPLHSHLVSSPQGRNPSPVFSAVQSFRVEQDRQGAAVEGEESRLLLTPSEMQKLKQQLNVEFSGPVFPACSPAADNAHLSEEKARTTPGSGKKLGKLDDSHTVRV